MTEQGAERREWDAQSYHRIANPHVDWGGPVLDRLELIGNETVIDAGCGTGRLTELLLKRLPDGHVLALDQSQNMLDEAEAYLKPTFGARVSFQRIDLLDLDLDAEADAVFSTATFHWISDHIRLFRHLFRALRPGGWLVAQCGGGSNIARIESRAMALLRSPAFVDAIGGWNGPWNFADEVTTAERMKAAGFTSIETNLIAAPVTMPDAAEYGEFLETVVFGAHIARLPTMEMRQHFIGRMVELGEQDHPPFELDYWRLNVQGRKPE